MRKIYKILLYSTPIFITSASITTYYFLNMTDNKDETVGDSKELISNESDSNSTTNGNKPKIINTSKQSSELHSNSNSLDNESEHIENKHEPSIETNAESEHIESKTESSLINGKEVIEPEPEQTPHEPSTINIEKIVEPKLIENMHKTDVDEITHENLVLQNLNENTKEIDHNIKIDTSNLFPALDRVYLYSLIRIVNNEPIITNNLIAKAIKQIITGLSTTQGSIVVYVKKESPQIVFISIDWFFHEQRKTITYKLSIAI